MELAETVAVQSAVADRAPRQVGVTQIVVAPAYGTPPTEPRASCRGDAKAAKARQVAMYLTHVVFEMNVAAVARGFGRDRTTAGHAIRCVEVLREDPERARVLGLLEAQLRRLEGGQ